MSANRRPQAHPLATAETVRLLLVGQHPDLAALELGTSHEGFDMAMFRLGGDLAVRMPRHEGAVQSLTNEIRWTETLGPGWDFPYPRIVRVGLPGAGYPWPWAVVTWLPGDIVAKHPLTAHAGPDLGRALAQVHLPTPDDAPFNAEESVPLKEREVALERSLTMLEARAGPSGRRCDLDAARSMWHEALAAPDSDERVWSHADLHGFNVLSREGHFGGIVDWADMAGCDRAVDLGFLHTLLAHDGVDAAVAEYHRLTGAVDKALLARMRGIGLWKCAGLACADGPLVSAMGWRGLEALRLVAR